MFGEPTKLLALSNILPRDFSSFDHDDPSQSPCAVSCSPVSALTVAVAASFLDGNVEGSLCK